MVNFHSVNLLRLLLSPVKPVCKEQKGCVSLEKSQQCCWLDKNESESWVTLQLLSHCCSWSLVLFLTVKVYISLEGPQLYFWNEMTGWDQSRDLVISNFISGIQWIQNVNKKQLHWHMWHYNFFSPILPLCRSGVITSTAVSRSDGACQYWKGRNLWKAMTSKCWSMTHRP